MCSDAHRLILVKFMLLMLGVACAHIGYKKQLFKEEQTLILSETLYIDLKTIS